MSSHASPSTPPIRRKPNLKRPILDSPSSPAPALGSPLQPSRHANVNIVKVNDDAAEKAARRKSAHFGDLGVGGDGKSAPTKRVVSALAVQAQQAAGAGVGVGVGGQGLGGQKRKRLSAVQPTAPVVSMEVMSTNFEEWMKLATDNKITATNTWNFALIDYFADLTLLRNGPNDQSINFQKASSTLDGCVKIWTSRVDSVATETGKLLSGLAGGPEDGDEGIDGDEEEGAEPKATRKRSEATLAKSFDALKVKKLDLEFTVDPLFKKTSADFDEGGAMGLLMNHLSVDGQGRVVFDAGDATLQDDEDEEMPEDEVIDISKLRDYVPSVEALEERNISDTLGSFRFSSDPNAIPDFSTLVGLKDSFNDEDETRPMNDYAMVATGEEQDFFGGEDFDVGGGLGYSGGFDDAASMAGDDVDAGDGYTGGLGMVAPGDSHAPFDPSRRGGELVMALVGGEEGEGMFDYFDKGFGKSWAGAEHWKLRKVTRKDATVSTAGTATKATKAAKQAFEIDFLSPSTSATSSKVLFAPASKSSLQLPSSKPSSSKRSKKGGADSRKRREEWLLPDDMHFSSRQLLRLFLKPKFSVRMRRNANAARMVENANGDVDENFWAQAAVEAAQGDGDMDGMDQPSAPIPFESQFFHDDGDDAADYAYVDDNLDAGDADVPMDGEADDLWQGTQGQELKKSKPENVNFAKKAKRVDVKRLKDDIWDGLKSLVPPETAPEEQVEPDTPAKSATEESKTFDSVIHTLRSSYPTSKMSEISTSFCFICLLHLANEEGLRIETARFDGKDGEDVGCKGVFDAEVDLSEGRPLEGEGEKRDRVVGELQALKVFKDPNAGRAA